MFYDTGLKAHSYKKCRATLQIILHFVMLGIKVKNNFTGEGKTTYTFSVSVNAFSVEFLLACYQQAGRVWYVSRALRRTYMLFYPAPNFTLHFMLCKKSVHEMVFILLSFSE